MNNKLVVVLALTLLAAFNSQPTTAFAQGTAFTYQGRLNSGGSPAGGLYDFRFKLYADPLGDTQAGATYLAATNVPIANGLFVTTMDFGADSRVRFAGGGVSVAGGAGAPEDPPVRGRPVTAAHGVRLAACQRR